MIELVIVINRGDGGVFSVTLYVCPRDSDACLPFSLLLLVLAFLRTVKACLHRSLSF